MNKCCYFRDMLIEGRVDMGSGWTPSMILVIVSQNHEISVEKIIGPRKFHSYVQARACAADLMRRTGMTLTHIGMCLGSRHYTTVIHLLKLAKKKSS